MHRFQEIEDVRFLYTLIVQKHKIIKFNIILQRNKQST